MLPVAVDHHIFVTSCCRRLYLCYLLW